MMFLVVIAALPCIYMAMYNTGLQANLALDPAKTASLEGWRHAVIGMLGVGYSPASLAANVIHGALYFLPLYIVTMVVGLTWEVLFAVVRKMEVNEGFFVTGLLFPLILPPTTPLWQAALGITFGVVVAKEVFGGTGMNFINPALAARAFLFFAYPAEISGDKVWAAVPEGMAVDGYSGATLLSQMRVMTGSFEAQGFSWWNAFIGLEPGSMGETSALACLIGAVIIIATGVGSWRTMAAATLGTVAMASLLNAIGSTTNPWFGVPFWWHMVLGSWAFGIVFMATDPVTSTFSEAGKWVYGGMMGALIVLIRVANPAYPESVMLVILFMNVMAPIIDHFFVQANVRRRKARRG
ncbi:MAG: NADH:ubiquinone reductase (Na(+)-transporting) subunit B [Burkholderiaceae bacterium]|nr:NADH:ubiquinone reductase (Na(+)-transporting) subunit B [Burkholderiaceae bacterium]